MIPPAKLILSLILFGAKASSMPLEESLGSPERVVGGKDADPGEYPYFASMIQNFDDGTYICGGTLITPNAVLFAAHCVFDGGQEAVSIDAYVGAMTIFDFSAQIRTCDEIIVHPEFEDNFGSFDYDVALCKFDEQVNVEWTTELRLDLNVDNSFPNAGDALTAIGLGATDFDTQALPDILQEVTLEYYTNDICDNVYNDDINENMLCAGNLDGGKDTCQGDSGGPLISISEGIHTLVGITSFGIGCALPDIPAVYARVSFVSDFLRSELPSLEEDCIDDASAEFIIEIDGSEKTKDCAWLETKKNLKVTEYCSATVEIDGEEKILHTICKDTCGNVGEGTCASDINCNDKKKDFEIEIDGVTKTKDCKWLETKKKSRKKEYCQDKVEFNEKTKKLHKICKETCGEVGKGECKFLKDG